MDQKNNIKNNSKNSLSDKLDSQAMYKKYISLLPGRNLVSPKSLLENRQNRQTENEIYEIYEMIIWNILLNYLPQKKSNCLVTVYLN